MDPQTLPLAQTMEKLDSALAKLQEIQCTLRGHISSGNGDGNQKDRLRCSDGWAERVRFAAAAAAPLTTKKGSLQRNDADASMAIAKKTVDMMKVQRMKSMRQKKQETPWSPSSPLEAAAAQGHLDMEATTFLEATTFAAHHQDPPPPPHHHHGDDEAGDGHRSKKQIKATDMVAKSSKENRPSLGHLDMTATTFLEATTFAAHHQDPPHHQHGDDEAGDGHRSKKQIKATDMVAKSSKENQDQAPSRLAHEHHLQVWKLPHLLMTRIPATDMEATTFAAHRQDPPPPPPPHHHHLRHHHGDGAGDGYRSKKQSTKDTDVVAKSSKENQDPAHQHHRHHHHHHHQEKYQHDRKKKEKEKKPSSCIVKQRSKEPLDMAMVMLAPPRICVQVEEVRPSKRSKEKAAIVMFPNPTFNHHEVMGEEEDQNMDKKMRVMKEEEEKKKKKEKKRMEMEEKVVRLAPCHGSRSNSSNSDGKLAMVEKKKKKQKQNRPCRLSHPIRDSLKRTSAFIQGMLF